METLPDGNSRFSLQVAELEDSLAALQPWNLREFEVPDVIGFKDFVHSRRSVAEALFVTQCAPTWGPALQFPYPNGRKLREIVVLDARDLTLLRPLFSTVSRQGFHEFGCDPYVIEVIFSGLRKWALVDKVSGLPIGPEASAILGNAFLIPIDHMLMSVGIQHVRWMDDFKLLGPTSRRAAAWKPCLTNSCPHKVCSGPSRRPNTTLARLQRSQHYEMVGLIRSDISYALEPITRSKNSAPPLSGTFSALLTSRGPIFATSSRRSATDGMTSPRQSSLER